MLDPTRNDRQLTGTVVSTGRLPSSVNGNPTCEITLQHEDGTTGTYRNETDASAGYAVENYRPGDRVTLFFRKRHTVTFRHITGSAS